MSDQRNEIDLEIRFAQEEDIENVTEFALIALNDSSMLTLFASDIGSEMMNRFRTSGPQNTILALDRKQNSIIGFIEVDPERSKEGICYFLSGLYILPYYRYKGIASKLVKQMLEQKCTKGEELIVKAFSDKEKRVWESLTFKTKSTTLSLKI